MSVELFYFSGTGNSLFVAKELKRRLPNAVLTPIAKCMNQSLITSSHKTIGLIFPVHALTIPIVVKQFLKKLDTRSAEYIFAIATREGTVFKGFRAINGILKKQGKRLNAQFLLTMYNNESRHENYSVPSKSDIRNIEINVLTKIDRIVNIIVNRETSLEKDTAATTQIEGPLPVKWFLEELVVILMWIAEKIGGVQYFYSDDTCNSCAVCEKICLSGKIIMRNEKPLWQKDVMCYMCFACLNLCPQEAVQIEDIPGVKSYTKYNGRYTHPYASVKDLIEQK
jgi:ferredoxin/flavodoxin